jgi:hypothetical protein
MSARDLPFVRGARSAIQFRDAVNERGGRVEIRMLPEAGLSGNTHFPFSDLNNQNVADLLHSYLRRHRLA